MGASPPAQPAKTRFGVAVRLVRRKVCPVRRHVSLFALCLAWLCANGSVWNVIQLVAWAKMFHDYSQVMPAARALQITFNGSAPCALCHLTEKAQDAARDQLPRDTALGGNMEKLLLLSESVPAVVVTAPDFAWPGVTDDDGLTRTESVPVPPPRV